MLDPQKLKKIIFILLGLLLIIGPLGYFFYQRNIFGQDKLRFDITAPDAVSAGEEVKYIVRYRNNSDTRLEEVILIFEYPENSVPLEKEEDENIIKRGNLRREVNIGKLNPGEEKISVFNAILLGQEGSSFEANALIRYVPRNLAARYELKREHMIVINKVPINFEFQIPATIDPDRENSFRLRFFSEVEYPLTDIEVRLTYPSGFRFIRSAPVSEAENKNIWTWSVLNKGDDGTIDVDGVLSGEPGDAKIFRAVLGVYVNDAFIVLREASRGTAISRSNLILEMQVNGQPEYVANPGELLHYEVFFRNIGKETLENLFLLVNLDTNTLNLDQVEPMEGRFQEERGVIIWSHNFDYALLSLKENEEAKVEFWVRVREDLPHNPEIKVKATIERAEKNLATKINTRVSLNQAVIRNGSPFETAGPFPFKENETSNYAVRWKITNHFNDIRNISIRTKLPEGARATGNKSPEDASLSFNSITREVVMDIESMLAGEVKEIFFEVEITPKKDFQPADILLAEGSITVEDRQTRKEISAVSGAVFLDGVLELN